MNPRALRRLAADHAGLHQDPPPNYIISHSDDLTQLDVLIAGPTHTPFAAGLWKLHLSMPSTYPQQPPTANFRTPIFHPNVDQATGGICVETLKRDWHCALTLRDVLVTISCLLIQPNPDSALNAEAGALIQEDYGVFAARAELMTNIHASIPKDLQAAVKEAQSRGQEHAVEECDGEGEEITGAVPTRRRRTIARVRASKRSDAPSHDPLIEQQFHEPQKRPFVFQAGNDDVFGISLPREVDKATGRICEDDTELDGRDQENDTSCSKASTPAVAMTPRRPHGVAVPLGELIMEREDSSSDMEPEYPPSPRKSPSKSPPKRRYARTYDSNENVERGESSRDAALRARNITPANPSDRPLLDDDSVFMDVTFEKSPSPRKPRRGLFETPQKRSGPRNDIFGSVKSAFAVSQQRNDVFTSGLMPGADDEIVAQQNPAVLTSQLWTLCGGDIKRWNRGDFDGEPFRKKAARW